MSVIILIFSVALFLFYIQATCERILAREFENALPEPIIEANALEFPVIRQLLESHAPAECSRLRERLKADCSALIYLLKHAANRNGGLDPGERLLALYFRALSALASLGRRSVLLKMIAVLEYFTNVLGERVKCARFSAQPARL